MRRKQFISFLTGPAKHESCTSCRRLTNQPKAEHHCVVAQAHWSIMRKGVNSSRASTVQPVHAADDCVLYGLLPFLHPHFTPPFSHVFHHLWTYTGRLAFRQPSRYIGVQLLKRQLMYMCWPRAAPFTEHICHSCYAILCDQPAEHQINLWHCASLTLAATQHYRSHMVQVFCS